MTCRQGSRFECKNAAADRYPRFARVTGRLPRLTEYPDLLRLLYVERTSALVIFCSFIPSLAAQPAVAFEPAPHQIDRAGLRITARLQEAGRFGNIG